MDPSVIAYPLAGALAGLLAGLLGIGGGLVIVPALVWIFGVQAFPATSLVHQAVGTSLATIVFTAASSAYAHHRRGTVRWPMVRRLAPGVVGGVLAGALVADTLGALGLRRAFGVLELAIAAYMALGGGPVRRSERPPGTPSIAAAGTLIGLVSGLAGIAGGTLTVPLLVHWRVRIHDAVATSAAVGLPVALAGTLGFVLTGLDAEVPSGSLGFVYLPALAGIAPASVLLAPLGARLAHRLPTAVLRRVFAALLALIGARMVLGA